MIDEIEPNTSQKVDYFPEESIEKKEEVSSPPKKVDAKGALKELDDLQDDLEATNKGTKGRNQIISKSKDPDFSSGDDEEASVDIKEFVEVKSKQPVTADRTLSKEQKKL